MAPFWALRKSEVRGETNLSMKDKEVTINIVSSPGKKQKDTSYKVTIPCATNHEIIKPGDELVLHVAPPKPVSVGSSAASTPCA